MKNIWLSWSTGKDSAFALSELKKLADVKVTGLFTTMTETYERVSMHSTRVALLRKQAEALDLPLHLVKIPNHCSNEVYEAQMRKLIQNAVAEGVNAMAFGDLYLEDVRSYREKMLKNTGIDPVFPLWKRATNKLAQEMIEAGIGAVLTCVDPQKIPASFAGRAFDLMLLKELPSGVDPCGENGEFHTFVHSSPNFSKAIPFTIGQKLESEGFVFQDILPS